MLDVGCEAGRFIATLATPTPHRSVARYDVGDVHSAYVRVWIWRIDHVSSSSPALTPIQPVQLGRQANGAIARDSVQ
jgi:hypothetical protein